MATGEGLAVLILDDLLLAPVHGLAFVFREVQKAARAELTDTRPIVQELQELYMLLETGKITEEEFSDQEAALLDRLDRADAAAQRA